MEISEVKSVSSKATSVAAFEPGDVNGHVFIVLEEDDGDVILLKKELENTPAGFKWVQVLALFNQDKDTPEQIVLDFLNGEYV